MQFYSMRVTHSENQIIVSHKQGKHIFHRKSTYQVNKGQFTLYDFSGFQTEDWLTDASILNKPTEV